MTTLRFDFQAECVRRALAELDGLILNVGCKEDPAGLKRIDPARVINCDLTDMDQDYEGQRNQIDYLFDCVLDKWPFAPGSAALVVLGDILEHLASFEIRLALKKARPIAARLCITVPQDEDDTTCDAYADQFGRGAKHRTIVTEGLLRSELERTGWKVTDWQRVDYGLWPVGHFVQAE